MVNVFSFSLYGPENRLYYKGMLENIVLIGKHFPTWKIYIYLGADVTTEMRNILIQCSNVVIKETGLIGSSNMIHRFFAIDEPEVELMMVRDADSRVHWKDRWAIREFLSKPYLKAHTIRDNVSHVAKMMGGLWGMRKIPGISIRKLYDSYKEHAPLKPVISHDQDFLANALYPLIVSKLLVHYSHSMVGKEEDYAYPFPFEWTNDIYCGRIEGDFIDLPQPVITRSNSVIAMFPRGRIKTYK